MIILPIEGSKHDEDDDDTPLEWSLLELNGELIPSKAAPEGDEMELGKVEFDSEVRNNFHFAFFRYEFMQLSKDLSENI